MTLKNLTLGVVVSAALVSAGAVAEEQPESNQPVSQTQSNQKAKGTTHSSSDSPAAFRRNASAEQQGSYTAPAVAPAPQGSLSGDVSESSLAVTGRAGAQGRGNLAQPAVNLPKQR
jgi:hypothetical protein